jgi:hypothetical protein
VFVKPLSMTLRSLLLLATRLLLYVGVALLAAVTFHVLLIGMFTFYYLMVR